MGVPASTIAKWKESVDFEIEDKPKNGTVTVPNARHRVTYMPQKLFKGEDNFSFLVKIGQDSTIASVTITVAADVTPPSTSFYYSQSQSKSRGGKPMTSDDDDIQDDFDEELKTYKKEEQTRDPEDFDIEVGLDNRNAEAENKAVFFMDSPLAHTRPGKSQEGEPLDVIGESMKGLGYVDESSAAT